MGVKEKGNDQAVAICLPFSLTWAGALGTSATLAAMAMAGAGALSTTFAVALGGGGRRRRGLALATLAPGSTFCSGAGCRAKKMSVQSNLTFFFLV